MAEEIPLTRENIPGWHYGPSCTEVVYHLWALRADGTAYFIKEYAQLSHLKAGMGWKGAFRYHGCKPLVYKVTRYVEENVEEVDLGS